jgi:serine/threonine-protein kinase
MDSGLLVRLRERGVFRVAASYAVIAWLVLQIADVTFDPLGLPKWVMTSLIVAAVLGFPVAVALAWFYEVGDHGVQRDTAAEGALRPSVHGKRRYADLAIIGVLLVTVAVLLVRQSDIGKPPPPASPAIAVLPFENLSGDPGQEYFSDGLAEEVLDRLGRVPGLKVIASSSSFSFKGKHQDAKTIASQLGVTTVLEGSVRRDGRKLKVNAKLIDGQSGFQLWSGSFDREVTDIFAVQAELAAAVIDAIVPAARGDVVAAPPPTTNLDAHDHYLLGLAAQRSRSIPRLADSVAHLEQAVALDPSYAQAHAALANSRLLLAGYGGVEIESASEVLASAERSAYKALALDPSLSDAHGALGNVLRYKEQPGAEEEYKRALELNPNNAIVIHNYAVLLSDLPGRKADVEALNDMALEIDPRSPIVWTNKLGRVLETEGVQAYRKQFDRALQVFAGDADGLGTLSLVANSATGYPYEAYKLSHAINRAGGDRTTVLLMSLDPLIAVGAYDEALARIDQIKATRGVAPLATAPLEIMAAGLKGDFKRLDDALAIPDRSQVADHYRYVVDAFWYSVQGRYAEGTIALARAGEFEQMDGGFLGTSLSDGALPAVVRIYNADGREQDAQAMVARFGERLRNELAGRTPEAAQNVLLAGIATAEGKRALAVRHLQAAMKQVPLPDLFYPQLPWFKSLEGEPGYAEVVAEVERRRTEIRAGIAALESGTGARAN